MVAILSPDAVSNVRMTADGYFQADLPEGYRYELVEAVVEMSPRPGTRHDDVLERLAELLCDYCRFRFESFVRFQPPSAGVARNPTWRRRTHVACVASF